MEERVRKPGPGRTLPGSLDDPSGLTVLALEFLRWMLAAGYAEETASHRQTYLSYFLEWCGIRGLTRPTEITRGVLEQFRMWLYRRRKADGLPLAFQTHALHIQAIKAFFKWLTRSNHLLYNPAADLELPRRPKRLPQNVLTHQEVEQVLMEPDLSRPVGVRDRAIMETFYSTGIRRVELARLALDDLDMNCGTVMVRLGKYRKDRMLPIGERAIAWIDRYLREARSHFVMPPDLGTLFLTSRGEPLHPKAITKSMGAYVNASGIGKSGSCHIFRHAMATQMLEAGADIRFIQEMLGHENLTTTQIYTKVTIKKLKEVHSKTHPSARLKAVKPQDLEEDGELSEEAFLSSLAEDFEDEDG